MFMKKADDNRQYGRLLVKVQADVEPRTSNGHVSEEGGWLTR